MPSKICKKCGRTVITGGFEPRYCPWGCGPLDEEPQEEKPKIGKDGQTLLFDVGSYQKTQDTFF